MVMGRELPPVSTGSPKPSLLLGTEALCEPKPTSFSRRDEHRFPLSYFSKATVSRREWVLASPWRAC